MVHEPDLTAGRTDNQDKDVLESKGTVVAISQSEPAQERPASTPVTQVMPPSQDDAEWDIDTKRAVLVILLIAFIGIFWLSRPVIFPLIGAGIVAYLLSPIVDLGERLRIPRSVSTLVLYSMLLVGLILIPVLLIPILLTQLNTLQSFDVYGTAVGLVDWEYWINNNPLADLPETISILGFPISIANFTSQIEQNYSEFTFFPTVTQILTYFQQLLGTATNVVSSTAAISFTVVGGILQFFITMILIFFLSLYMTKDAPSIRAYVEGLFPQAYEPELVDLLKRIGTIWQAFFRGQIILCLLIGTITWLVLVLAGMRGALVLGIVAGLLEIIPNVGPTLAVIPAVIVALTQDGSLNPYLANLGPLGFASVTIAIYFIIQQIENHIIVPRVIGDSVNLHPVVIICGVIVGFNVAGLLGVFLAAPVIASFRVLGSYIHAKLLGNPPFYEPETQQTQQRLGPFSYRFTITGKELAARRRRKRRATKQEETQPTPTESSEPISVQLNSEQSVVMSGEQ